ncbi:hypothetical protein H6F51_24785 [Cyanobacteria bacterium FACHB-DQ100]|nr:hypothetical protein [Cyanobacteria bacterium FACHB-DQ100]
MIAIAPPNNPLTLTSLTGLAAFRAFLSVLAAVDGSKEIWIKIGHNKFFVGDWNDSGNFELFATSGQGAERRRTYKVTDKAFDYLCRKCRELDGGVFYISTQPQDNPLKECVSKTDDIGIEIDQGSREEQIALYQRFSAVTALNPALLITSGGKSVHGHFKFDRHYPVEQIQSIRRLMVLAFLADPVTVRLHQPMRLPGFSRREKGREQELLYYSHDRYTPDQILAGLQKWFDYSGWNLPEEMPEDWWRDRFHSALKTSAKLNEQQKHEFVRAELAKGLVGYRKEIADRAAAREQKRIELSKRVAVGNPNLIELVQEACDRLGSDAFTLYPHDWKFSGQKARGRCCNPSHQSASGTSAWIAPNPNGGWGYHCTACTDDKPIDAFGYWLYNKRYWGCPYPSGKDWIEAAREFLKDSGVEVPNSPAPHYQGFKTACAAYQDDADTEQAEQSKRDRLINKRKLRFLQYWESLKRDFLLPPLVSGNEIRFQSYQGFAPIIDLFWDTNCLQGWLGAGKTESMLRSLIPFKDKPIVLVSPRNGLLRQTAQRAKKLGFNVYHYQDDPGKFRAMLEAGEPGIYCMAPDSFKPYAVGKLQWEDVILILDEFCGIRKEILGKTAELPQVTDAIARCASLIAVDAFLSEIDIRVIQKHRSGSMQILNQEFKKSPVKIKWLECRNKAGEISFSHEGIYYSLLDRWIDEKLGRIAIAVDSIHTAKMLDRYLKSKGVKTWIVCSETPQENQSFMPEPDNVIEHGKIQAVIYTPTAQSGLDIQAKFDRGLLICTGTLAPTQMLQMLGRCRQCPEWYVSAPRHSGNPECVTPSLDSKKIRQWAEQIAQTLMDLGFNMPLEVQGWAVWERLIRDIEKAFTSEYMRCLLDYFFESVETVEVESDRVSEWRKDAQILKSEDAERTLKANLQNGLRLIDEEKEPKLNSEVWDIKLAQFLVKYPNIAKKAIADVEQSEVEVRQANAEIDSLGGCDAIRGKLSELAANIEQLTDAIEILDERLDILKRFYAESDSPDDWQALVDARREWFLLANRRTNAFAEYAKLDRLLQSARAELGSAAIELTKLFHSRRVEKLKNYITATEPNEQDDRDLLQYLRERPAHYNVGNFKRLQNIKLFRVLNLGKLASVSTVKEIEADLNAFRAASDAIAKLHRQFQANSELARLFPLIDSQKSFFDHIKACMSYLGYEKGGKSIRVETEELNPNGKDRHGKQRFSKSRSIYFVFWFLMECSGSAYFRDNLELILQSIRDRLAAEREERAKQRERKERYESPPPGWEAYVA